MAEFIFPDSIPDAVYRYIYTSQKTETKPLYIFLGLTLTLTLTLTLWLLHTEQNGLNNVQC